MSKIMHPAEIFGIPIHVAAQAAGAMGMLARAGGKRTALGERSVYSAAQAFQTARVVMAASAPFVDVLASYDNPRQQYLTEMALLRGVVRRAAHARHPGLSAEAADNRVSGKDIASAVGTVLVGLTVSDRDRRAIPAPMTRRMVALQLKQSKLSPNDLLKRLPGEHVLAAAAPEFMRALGFRDEPIMDSVLRRAGILRPFARHVPKAKGIMAALEYAAPIIGEQSALILPTSGAELRRRFDLCRQLLDI